VVVCLFPLSVSCFLFLLAFIGGRLSLTVSAGDWLK
jgi:hypothetical protein